jgi:hypothetical protein
VTFPAQLQKWEQINSLLEETQDFANKIPLGKRLSMRRLLAGRYNIRLKRVRLHWATTM